MDIDKVKDKAIKVIESCETESQLEGAIKYVDYLIDLYPEISITIIIILNNKIDKMK